MSFNSDRLALLCGASCSDRRNTLAIFTSKQEQLQLVASELDARRAQAERFRLRDIREEPWLPTIDRDRMSQILDHVHDNKARALATHVSWLEEILAELSQGE